MTDPRQPRVDVRRVAPAGADDGDSGEDTGLVERIRDEIRDRGPMPFVRFMELALYDPDGGYYRAPDPRPGRRGDFLTAPELHPVFGETLAVALREIWERLGRPVPFTIREHGAGAGAMALAILGGIHDERFGAAIRYEPVEVDPRRLDTFRNALHAAGHRDRLGNPADEHEPFEGVVLANEVLDALPVHRVRQRGDRLRELAVDAGPDGDLREVEIDPTTPALARRLADEGVGLRDGQTAEISLELNAWMATATPNLRRGLAILIDYGYPARELYDPVRRPHGTLRAYTRHRVHDDLLRHVGRQDLTAHVDVTAVERAAHTVGLATVGITTQAEALMGLGIADRLAAAAADPATEPADYSLLRASLMRLLDPAAMGRFRVMVFGRDWRAAPGDPPLRIFAVRATG